MRQQFEDLLVFFRSEKTVFVCGDPLRGDNPLIVAWLLRNAYLHYLRRFLAQIFSIDSNHAPLSLQKIWASLSLF